MTSDQRRARVLRAYGQFANSIAENDRSQRQARLWMGAYGYAATAMIVAVALLFGGALVILWMPPA